MCIALSRDPNESHMSPSDVPIPVISILLRMLCTTERSLWNNYASQQQIIHCIDIGCQNIKFHFLSSFWHHARCSCSKKEGVIVYLKSFILCQAFYWFYSKKPCWQGISTVPLNAENVQKHPSWQPLCAPAQEPASLSFYYVWQLKIGISMTIIDMIHMGCSNVCNVLVAVGEKPEIYACIVYKIRPIGCLCHNGRGAVRSLSQSVRVLLLGLSFLGRRRAVCVSVSSVGRCLNQCICHLECRWCLLYLCVCVFFFHSDICP